MSTRESGPRQRISNHLSPEASEDLTNNMVHTEGVARFDICSLFPFKLLYASCPWNNGLFVLAKNGSLHHPKF